MSVRLLGQPLDSAFDSESEPESESESQSWREMTYQHQLFVLLLQQAAVEELVQRHHIGEVESLAAQTFVGSAPKAQAHYGFALEKGEGGIG